MRRAKQVCDRCEAFAPCKPVDGIKVKDKGATEYRAFVACAPCVARLDGKKSRTRFEMPKELEDTP